MYTVEGGEKWEGEREKRGGRARRSQEETGRALLLRRRAYIAVACRSYLIQSWIMLRQDGDVYARYTIRKKCAPATRINSRHAGKRATAASVSVDGTRDDVCKTFYKTFYKRDIRFAHKDNDTSVKRERESL